jgi:phage terminase large subunit GpA-like protein
MTSAEQLVSECCKLWAPPPKLTLSEWAEENFYLSPEYSAATGKLTLYKFQRGILDSFTDPYVTESVVMSATQLIKTLFQQCAIAFVIANDPGPILAVQPTETAAESFSKERLGPMLRDLPCLHGKISEAKRGKGDNTILQKMFPGGSLTLIGAQTPDNFARRSIRYLFGDERDKWPLNVGKEGDGWSLGVKRQATFRSLQKRVQTCSPTIEGRSQIAEAYTESDQRKFWVPCPHCGECQVLKWGQVKDPRLPGEQPETTLYQCAICGQFWDDQERWAQCEEGDWRADQPFRGTAGFWISELYSPWKRLEELVSDFIAKKDNPAELQTFINTSLAETWKEYSEALDWEVLMSRREEYRRGTVPAGVRFLTAGVDCQKTWLEGYTWGWGDNRQRWVIDHFRVERNPFDEQAWTELEEQLRHMYPCEDGSQMGLTRMCIDTGYASNEVYRFARRFGAAAVLAVDGRTSGEIANAPSQVDVTVGGRKIKHGCKLWGVNVSKCKSELYGLLARERPADGAEYPAGWVHFPADMPADFFRQLTAERLVCRIVKGFPKWEWEKDPGARNEALDCHNYARAGAAVVGWDRNRMPVRRVEIAPRSDTPVVQVPAAPAPVIAQQQVTPRSSGGGYFGNRGRGWFNR